MNHKIFTNFIKILVLLQIFEVLVKKIRITYKNILKNFEFSIVCIDHHEQHNGG
jgi:hypothetical protein